MKPRVIAISVLFAYLLFGTWAFSNPVVVIPERFKDRQVIVENGPEFKSLVQKNKELSKQLAGEQKARADLEKKVSDELRAKDDELQKLRAEKAQGHKGVWSMVLGVLNIGVMFFTNPLGYMMTTAMSIVEGLIGVVVILVGLKFAYKLYTKQKSQPPKQ